MLCHMFCQKFKRTGNKHLSLKKKKNLGLALDPHEEVHAVKKLISSELFPLICS